MNNYVVILVVIYLGMAQNLPMDDVFSVKVNTPTCLQVLQNDPKGTTIVSAEGGVLGKTYYNLSKFYYAEDTIWVEAESFAKNPYKEYDNPQYTEISNTWAPIPFAEEASPNKGSNVGDTNWGPGLLYNVIFLMPGIYTVWVRGETPNRNSQGDDSLHVLRLDPILNTTVFMTYGEPLEGYTVNPMWLYCHKAMNIYPQNLGITYKMILAMKEDGVIIDRFALTNSSSWSLFAEGDPESPSINCTEDEILYVPVGGYTGVDIVQYNTTDGSANVTIYVGVAEPSPSGSPTSSVTPTASASPSATPSSTASAEPTASSTPFASASVTSTTSPSVLPASASPSFAASVSTTPSSSPAASPSKSPSSSPSASRTPSVTPSTSPSASASVTPSRTPSMSSSSSVSPSSSIPAVPSVPHNSASITPSSSVSPSASSTSKTGTADRMKTFVLIFCSLLASCGVLLITGLVVIVNRRLHKKREKKSWELSNISLEQNLHPPPEPEPLILERPEIAEKMQQYEHHIPVIMLGDKASFDRLKMEDNWCRTEGSGDLEIIWGAFTQDKMVFHIFKFTSEIREDKEILSDKKIFPQKEILPFYFTSQAVYTVAFSDHHKTLEFVSLIRSYHTQVPIMIFSNNDNNNAIPRTVTVLSPDSDIREEIIQRAKLQEKTRQEHLETYRKLFTLPRKRYFPSVVNPKNLPKDHLRHLNACGLIVSFEKRVFLDHLELFRLLRNFMSSVATTNGILAVADCQEHNRMSWRFWKIILKQFEAYNLVTNISLGPKWIASFSDVVVEQMEKYRLIQSNTRKWFAPFAIQNDPFFDTEHDNQPRGTTTITCRVQLPFGSKTYLQKALFDMKDAGTKLFREGCKVGQCIVTLRFDQVSIQVQLRENEKEFLFNYPTLLQVISTIQKYCLQFQVQCVEENCPNTVQYPCETLLCSACNGDNLRFGVVIIHDSDWTMLLQNLDSGGKKHWLPHKECYRALGERLLNETTVELDHRKYLKSDNPSKIVLQDWQVREDATIGVLIQALRKIHVQTAVDLREFARKAAKRIKQTSNK